MMQKKKLYKLFILIMLLFCQVFLYGNISEESQIEVSNVAILTEYDEVVEIPEKDQESVQDGGSNTSLQYVPYKKGDKTVNVLFNFINYKNDNDHKFSFEEIESLINEFRVVVPIYFDRMSQGYVDINIDYVCSIAPLSYEDYLEKKNANYTIESNLLKDAADAGKDYYGNPKSFLFANYNFRVNAFAGNSGNWNTFLWPHAYSSSNLILMMQNKKGAKMSYGTLCHEMMHTFGVGDLYAYTGDSQYFGAQGMDLMASSAENTSTNAYYREQVGWIASSSYDDNIETPIEELSGNSYSYNLNINPNCTSNYGKTIAYKFGENKNNGEYFMIEYKIVGYEDKFDYIMPYTGVVIYRVNPGVKGNSQGNNNKEIEIMFMGDTSHDITTLNYTKSIILTTGSVFGNVGETTTTSLTYSSGAGKSNLFNGGNSEIIVSVISMDNDDAQVTIYFSNGRESIDMSEVKWNYSNAFSYSNQNYQVKLINVPTLVTVSYSGVNAQKNAGTYNVKAIFTYDENRYFLYNLNVLENLTWEILPEKVFVNIHNKASKYGDELSTLTSSIASGTVYTGDELNISLTKSGTNNAGIYSIEGSWNNKNYDVVFKSGTYTITHRIINIKVYNQSYELDFFQNIKQSSYEILTNGDDILSQDNVNIELYAENFNANNLKLGNYILNANINNSNYKLRVDTGNLRIYKKVDLTDVKWNYESEYAYNSEIYNVKLINIPSMVTVDYSGTTWAKNAGKYSVSVELQYDLSIFEIININFIKTLIWEIRPQQIYLEIDDQTSRYGDVLNLLTYSVNTGTVYKGDDPGIFLEKEGSNNAGIYSINAGCSNKNYEIVAESGKYTITPRQISIELIDQTFKQNKYDQLNQTKYTISSDGEDIVHGDDLKIFISANVGDNVEMGEYDIFASCGNPNYQITVKNPAKLTIIEPLTFETVMDDVGSVFENVGAQLFDNIVPIMIVVLSALLVLSIGIGLTIHFVRKKKKQD